MRELGGLHGDELHGVELHGDKLGMMTKWLAVGGLGVTGIPKRQEVTQMQAS